MGIDLNVIVGHALAPAAAAELADRFEQSVEVRGAATALASVLHGYGPSFAPRPFRWDSADARERADALNAGRYSRMAAGCGGLVAHVARHALVLVFPLRLASVADDAGGRVSVGGFARPGSVASAVRALAGAIARELGAGRALYVPDSRYDVSVATSSALAGTPFDAIVDDLRARFGEPAPSLAALKQQEGGGRYWLDERAPEPS
jgi:hypothetical protein